MCGHYSTLNGRVRNPPLPPMAHDSLACSPVRGTQYVIPSLSSVPHGANSHALLAVRDHHHRLRPARRPQRKVPRSSDRRRAESTRPLRGPVLDAEARRPRARRAHPRLALNGRRVRPRDGRQGVYPTRALVRTFWNAWMRSRLESSDFFRSGWN